MTLGENVLSRSSATLAIADLFKVGFSGSALFIALNMDSIRAVAYQRYGIKRQHVLPLMLFGLFGGCAPSPCLCLSQYVTLTFFGGYNGSKTQGDRQWRALVACGAIDFSHNYRKGRYYKLTDVWQVRYDCLIEEINQRLLQRAEILSAIEEGRKPDLSPWEYNLNYRERVNKAKGL